MQPRCTDPGVSRAARRLLHGGSATERCRRNDLCGKSSGKEAGCVRRQPFVKIRLPSSRGIAPCPCNASLPRLDLPCPPRLSPAAPRPRTRRPECSRARDDPHPGHHAPRATRNPSALQPERKEIRMTHGLTGRQRGRAPPRVVTQIAIQGGEEPPALPCPQEARAVSRTIRASCRRCASCRRRGLLEGPLRQDWGVEALPANAPWYCRQIRSDSRRKPRLSSRLPACSAERRGAPCCCRRRPDRSSRSSPRAAWRRPPSACAENRCAAGSRNRAAS